MLKSSVSKFPKLSKHHTQGFLTQDLFHSTSLATWGSSGASKETKFFQEQTFFILKFCALLFSQNSKMSKTELRNVHFGQFFKVCSSLAEKQRTKQKIVNSLNSFASFDASLDPQVARLVEIYPVLHFVLKFHSSSAPYNFHRVPQGNT